ncbi:MAG: hypothetical protein ABFD54_15105 [Armatimonadota bacterium]|nr:hypothetical protein [bacterium]
MSTYITILTTAGKQLLQDVQNGTGKLDYTLFKCGSGEIGAGDPTALNDLISTQQEFSAIDIKRDENNIPFVWCWFSNAGVITGYYRMEMGLFGREHGGNTDTLIAYFYAETQANADYIPVPDGGIAVSSPVGFHVAASADLELAVTVDASLYGLSLDRWAAHLAGAGGADQHPNATAAIPGLMPAADKAKLDGHINTITPTKGTSIHGSATTTSSGFMSAVDKANVDAHINTTTPTKGTTIHSSATTTSSGFMGSSDKMKLDGIAAGAEVNQNVFSSVKVGTTTIAADAKTDVLELAGSTYITLTPDAANDKVVIEGQNLTPSSHIGSNGNAHAVATQAANGFMSAADKTKLDGLNYVNLSTYQNIYGGKTFYDPICAYDDSAPLTGLQFKITAEGGYAVRLINKTGAASIKGMAVKIASTMDGAFAVHNVAYDCVAGFVYESGIADGSATWVVVAGIAKALIKAGEALISGDWLEALSNGRMQKYTNPNQAYTSLGPIVLQACSNTGAEQLVSVLMAHNVG